MDPFTTEYIFMFIFALIQYISGVAVIFLLYLNFRSRKKKSEKLRAKLSGFDGKIVKYRNRYFLWRDSTVIPVELQDDTNSAKVFTKENMSKEEWLKFIIDKERARKKETVKIFKRAGKVIKIYLVIELIIIGVHIILIDYFRETYAKLMGMVLLIFIGFMGIEKYEFRELQNPSFVMIFKDKIDRDFVKRLRSISPAVKIRKRDAKSIYIQIKNPEETLSALTKILDSYGWLIESIS